MAYLDIHLDLFLNHQNRNLEVLDHLDIHLDLLLNHQNRIQDQLSWSFHSCLCLDLRPHLHKLVHQQQAVVQEPALCTGPQCTGLPSGQVDWSTGAEHSPTGLALPSGQVEGSRGRAEHSPPTSLALPSWQVGCSVSAGVGTGSTNFGWTS